MSITPEQMEGLLASAKKVRAFSVIAPAIYTGVGAGMYTKSMNEGDSKAKALAKSIAASAAVAVPVAVVPAVALHMKSLREHVKNMRQGASGEEVRAIAGKANDVAKGLLDPKHKSLAASYTTSLSTAATASAAVSMRNDLSAEEKKKSYMFNLALAGVLPIVPRAYGAWVKPWIPKLRQP